MTQAEIEMALRNARQYVASNAYHVFDVNRLYWSNARMGARYRRFIEAKNLLIRFGKAYELGEGWFALEPALSRGGRRRT